MTKNKIVISVSGGNVNGVFLNDPNTTVYLVDFDNLKTDPDDDCSQSFPTGKIEKFRTLVAKDNYDFPGVAKLLSRLNNGR